MRSRVRPMMTFALFDDDACIRRNRLAVDERAVSRAEIPHADAAVVEQRQECVLRRRIFVVHDDVAVEVTA